MAILSAMRLASLRITSDDGQESVRPGRLDGDEIVLLDAPNTRSVLAALSAGETVEDSGESVSWADASLAPVVPDPPKVICVGVNYRDHIEEMGREAPQAPTYFAKFARSLVGAHDDLMLPPAEMSTSVDWECELAVVIGREARNVDRSDAIDHVGGYTVLNDVSVRDFQRRTSQFLAGKMFDRLTPVGPLLVPASELGDGSGLAISTIVNGVVKQSANTDDLVFDVADIIADLSRIITLEVGDIIATGTPGGVGAARVPPEFLSDGDQVVTEIEGIGRLANRCVGVDR